MKKLPVWSHAIKRNIKCRFWDTDILGKLSTARESLPPTPPFNNTIKSPVLILGFNFFFHFNAGSLISTVNSIVGDLSIKVYPVHVTKKTRVVQGNYIKHTNR